MTRYTIVGLALAFALFGCGRGQSTRQESLATAATDKADEAMTVVGCLVPSGETQERRAVGTSGNPEPPGFTLVNVAIPEKGSGARAFDLVADESRLEDLQRFANSRVEVTGSIVASTGLGVSDVSAGSAPAGAPPSDVRRLRVRDVRQVEPTCGEPKKD